MSEASLPMSSRGEFSDQRDLAKKLDTLWALVMMETRFLQSYGSCRNDS